MNETIKRDGCVIDAAAVLTLYVIKDAFQALTQVAISFYTCRSAVSTMNKQHKTSLDLLKKKKKKGPNRDIVVEVRDIRGSLRGFHVVLR